MTIPLAHAVLGQGEMALLYAQKCLDYFLANPETDWDLAFAHLEMANAAVVIKDATRYQEYYERVKELGEAIVEEEDRRIFMEELGKVILT